jgi:hypothetical protein
MKRFSLLLGVLILVLWSFCIAGYATYNFKKMPAALFDRGTKLNGLWIRVLDLEKFERTTWTEDRKEKGDLVKQDSLLRTWQHVLDTPDSKVEFDPTELPDMSDSPTDSNFKPSFRPGFHYQNDVTYLSANTVPISDSRILLIFSIGLVLVGVSNFGRKIFKRKKGKSIRL